MTLTNALRLLTLLVGFMVSGQAFADCSNPAGVVGEQRYASNYGVMAFCDGSRWVSMAGGVSVTVNAGGGGATPAGSTADVQFNSAGVLAADTGNFTYSAGLLSTPNLNTGNVSATTINATGLGTMGSLVVAGGATVTGQASLTVISTSLIQVGDSGASCTSSLAGGVRYNSTSNTIDYCSGSAWLSLGPSATVVPGFKVTKGGTNQTGIAASTDTLLTWSTKVFDTNNNFSSNRYTPNVPGYYQFSLQVLTTATASSQYVCGVIKKNGFSQGQNCMNIPTAAGAGQPVVTVIAYMNGSTDYAEAYVNDSGTDVAGSVTNTFFQGNLLTVGGGGGGGAANPAGSTNDIQFNSGGLLAADSGNFTYTTATGTLSATTISTTVTNFASVTTIANLIGGSGNMISSGSAVVSTSSGGSITFYSGGSQRMALGNSGRLGIGMDPVSNPSALLQVSGSIYSMGTVSGTWSGAVGIAQGSYINYMQMTQNADTYFASNHGANFQVAGGNLAVSTNSLNLVSGPPNPGVLLSNGGVVQIGNSAGATGWGFLNFYRSGTFIGNVSQNGTTAVLYNTTSDRRMKENITGTREGLQKLMRLPVRDFAFRADPSHTIVTGFIAQELEKVFPEAVTTNGDDGETPLKGKSKPWSVDYGRVTPLIVKATQELNGKVDELTVQLKAANDNIKKLTARLDADDRLIEQLKKSHAK